MIRKLLSALVALGLFAWLLAEPRAQQALVSLFALPWTVLGVLVVTQSASYLCRGGRLYSQFNPRIRLGFLAYLRISLLHNMSVNVIPFRGGELTLPVMLQGIGLRLPEAFATLLWLRLQDAFVLVLMTLALWPGIPLVLRVAGIAAMLAGIVFFAFGNRRRLDGLRQSLARTRLAKLVDTVWHIFDASAVSWGWSLANWTTKLVGLAVVLAALSDLSFSAAAGGALGGEVSALLPIQGVAGFGTYEAGVAFALRQSSDNWLALFTAAFALHCFTLLLALIAGSLAWFAIPARTAALDRSSETKS